jgi:hypothetical protein
MDLRQTLVLAQRIAASLEPSDEASIEPRVYRDRPDFEALFVVEKSYVVGAPPPVHPEGSWLSFVFSKPSIGERSVEIHLLEAIGPRGEPGDELWIKLKRAEALTSLFPHARRTEHAARALNQAILQDAIARVGGNLERFTFGADQTVGSGPEWLKTPLEVERNEDRVSLRSPVTYSPVDAPPRFAGMHYMKVISPAWAERAAMRKT